MSERLILVDPRAAQIRAEVRAMLDFERIHREQAEPKYAPLNPAAIYRGGPPAHVVTWIMENTRGNDRGRLYYRDRHGAERRLRTPADYAELNRLLDLVR